MSERHNSNPEFHAILRASLSREEKIIEAAHDHRLMGAIEWLHIGRTKLIPRWEIDGVEGLDAEEIWEEARSKHGLDEESMEEAADICEALVKERIINGET